MIQKIFWFFVIVLVLYVLLIFKVPTVADSIEDAFWFGWFNQAVLEFKDLFDNTVTDIPTKNEIENKYTETLSGAHDFKNNVVDTLDFTRDKINDVRGTLSGAEDTYNSTIKFLSGAVQTIEETEDFINRFKDVVNSASWVINTASGIIK